MKVSIVGDTHGKAMEARQFSDGAIQVGDFNLTGYDAWKPLEGRRVAFIDGNHDHFPSLKTRADAPQEVQPGLFYIPRGWVCGKVMFMGGAESIDANMRHVGWDVFFEESITQADFTKAFAHDGKIEVFIAHTCPDFVSSSIMKRAGGFKYNQSSEIALRVLWEHFKPSLWIFGHFHLLYDQTIDDTRFMCLPTLQVRKFDLPLENWPAVLSDQ
jgi:predicted phosphodiesterase